MQLFINSSNLTTCFLIPITKTDNLTTRLKDLGEKYGFSAEFSEQICLHFKAESKENFPILTEDGRKICLLGCNSVLKGGDLVNVFRGFSFHQKSRIKSQMTVDFRFWGRDLTETDFEAAVNGLLLGTYALGQHKAAPPSTTHPFKVEDAFLNIQIPQKSTKKWLEIAESAQKMADTQQRVMDLVNAPANFKTPEHLGAWAIQSAANFGYKSTVFDLKGCQDLGLHALIAVGQGSANESRFIVNEYKTDRADAPTVALVGKGVTFDTGGISIKPSANMYLMKSDMGGAAAVLGAVEVAARLKLPVNVIGVVGATENMPDGKAYRPSDVISSYSGKTIEIIDTDAEGRLVLADALHYAVKNFSPDYLIDLATLTGSAVAALGYQCAALLTPSDEMAQLIDQAGQQTGEKVWRLPMWEAYLDDMKSDVADIANLGSKPVAGAITAAKFLEVFTDKHPNWAHLDIAAVAMTANEYGAHRNATAYGVKLLTELLTELGNQK